MYIHIYYKERKILKDEVQQDGKNANMPQPGIEPGTPADTAGALPTELPRDQAETQPVLVTSKPSCFYPPAPSDRHKLVCISICILKKLLEPHQSINI